MMLKIRNKCLLKIEIRKEDIKTIDENGVIITEKGGIDNTFRVELFNLIMLGFCWDNHFPKLYLCYLFFNFWKSNNKKKLILTTWRFETKFYYRYCCDLFGWNKNLTPYFRIPQKYLQET